MTAIRLSQLKQLTDWQQKAFAAALLQRMLPNYDYFSKAVEFGEYKILATQIDLIWQKLSLFPVKFNLEVQLEKLYAITPDASQFDCFAVYPAQDVCTGMVELLESLDQPQSECAIILSRLSHQGVKAYLNYTHQAENPEVDLPEDYPLQEPLYLWEREVQKELFELVSQSRGSKTEVQAIKKLVMEQQLSNLAIDYA